MPKIERNIQYYGILKLPENIEKLKFLYLCADIIRSPEQAYFSNKTYVQKSFFGYLQKIRDERVVETTPLEYENQVMHTWFNNADFLHKSVSCSLEAVLTSLINLGLFLQPGFPTERNNPIKDWVVDAVDFDYYQIKLLTERTVCKLTLLYEYQENCTVPLSDNDPPKRPRLPPPLSPPVPADLPNEELPDPISPPYTGVNDDGKTYNPDSLPPEVPDTLDCIGYNCVIQFEYSPDNQAGISPRPFFPQQFTGNFWGPVVSLDWRIFQTGQLQILVECKGEISFPFSETCDTQISKRIAFTIGSLEFPESRALVQNLRFASVTEIPIN